ncbi:unnamed protein product, partial [Didymodactylos carnosus]
ANSNEQLTDHKQKVELLNQHFAAVCSMPTTEAIDIPTVIPTQSKFAMSGFSVLETERLIYRKVYGYLIKYQLLSANHLGLVLKCNLDWTAYVDYVLSKTGVGFSVQVLSICLLMRQLYTEILPIKT